MLRRGGRISICEFECLLHATVDLSISGIVMLLGLLYWNVESTQNTRSAVTILSAERRTIESLLGDRAARGQRCLITGRFILNNTHLWPPVITRELCKYDIHGNPGDHRIYDCPRSIFLLQLCKIS